MTSLLKPGAEVAGYRVLSELGRGGMGLVYEAEHVRLGRKAALKLLTPDLAADSNVRDRFVQESRLIAAIDHPTSSPSTTRARSARRSTSPCAWSGAGISPS
jgi:serine/threonine protein kinase